MRAIILSATLTVPLAGCHVVNREDVELLAAEGPYNNSLLASEICGKPVSSVEGAVATREWPRVELLSWTPSTGKTGAVTAHIVGLGSANAIVALHLSCIISGTF